MHRLTVGSRGFSLIEQVIAIASVAVISAVLVPTAVSQLGKSEVSRIQQDLQAVERSLKAFRTDVGTWPATLSQLQAPPRELQLDVFGNILPPTLYSQWKGPYYEPRAFKEVSKDDARLMSAAGTFFVDQLGFADWADRSSTSADRYIAVMLEQVRESQALALSRAIDGDPDLSGGRVRWTATGPSAGVLIYLAGPVERGVSNGLLAPIVSLPTLPGLPDADDFGLLGGDPGLPGVPVVPIVPVVPVVPVIPPLGDADTVSSSEPVAVPPVADTSNLIGEVPPPSGGIDPPAPEPPSLGTLLLNLLGQVLELVM